MEKEHYIWKGKIYFFQRRTKPENKTVEYIWRRKICFLQRRRLTVEKKEESIWRGKIYFFAEEKNNGEENGGLFARGWSIQMNICKTRQQQQQDHRR